MPFVLPALVRHFSLVGVGVGGRVGGGGVGGGGIGPRGILPSQSILSPLASLVLHSITSIHIFSRKSTLSTQPNRHWQGGYPTLSRRSSIPSRII